MKNAFYLKSSFRSRDVQFSVFFSHSFHTDSKGQTEVE